MYTLGIEHAITDITVWRQAFDRFADARVQAGVLAERVRRPVGDAHYLVVELDFASQEAAEAYAAFLTTVIWPSRDAAPALCGTPVTRILEPAPAGA